MQTVNHMAWMVWTHDQQMINAKQNKFFQPISSPKSMILLCKEDESPQKCHVWKMLPLNHSKLQCPKLAGSPCKSCRKEAATTPVFCASWIYLPKSKTQKKTWGQLKNVFFSSMNKNWELEEPSLHVCAKIDKYKCDVSIKKSSVRTSMQTWLYTCVCVCTASLILGDCWFDCIQDHNGGIEKALNAWMLSRVPAILGIVLFKKQRAVGSGMSIYFRHIRL